MANTKVTGDLIASSTIATGNIADNAVTSDKISGITTAHITEGSNLYYTNARARGAVSVSGNALSYNSSTGVITSNFEEAPTFTGDITLQGGRIYVKESDLGNNAVAITRDADEGYLQLFSSGSQTIELRGNGNSYFNGGNVGIGTASPNGKLNISNGGANGLEIDPTQSSGAVTLLQSYNRSGSAYTLMRMNAGSYEFQIADSTKMRIDSSGNVGIGTTSPSFNVGSGLEISRAGVATLRVTDSAGTTGSTELLQADADGYLFTRQSGALVFGTNDTERMRIDSSGKVGIGTTSPSEKLHVVDTNAGVVRAPLRLQNEGTTTGTGVELYLTTKTSGGGGGNTTSILRSISTDTSGNCDMVFLTPQTGSASEKMRIKSNGKVGIGTTSPKTNLEVIGGLNISTDTTSATTTTMRIGSYGASSQTYYGAKIVAHTNFTSTANTDLSFDLGSLGEVMRLHCSGSEKRVGIGTTSPNAGLEIKTLSGGSGVNTLRLNTSFANGNTVDINPFITGLNNGGMEIKLAGSQKLVMLPSGDVGIGTASPTARLDVSQASGSTLIRLSNSDATLVDAGDIQARLLFAGRYYSGSGTQNVTSEIRQIKNNGDGYGGGAEMAFLTNDTERMRILSSGGITFNGDTAAANALDDYEEGTFTPDLGAGTYSYQHREGHYVKIGNMVHIHIGFKLSSASPTSSTASIGGLPFSGKSWGSYQEPHERVGAAGELITANLSSHLSFYVTNGGSTLYARTTANNADNPVAANAIWKTNSFIKLQLIYTVS
jgi:hypothetical protein